MHRNTGLLTNEGHSGGHVKRLRLGARQMWVGLVTWLDWQCCEGKLGMVVAIPQMKCTRPVGSGGEAESVSTERGGSLRPSHNPTHNCLALYCRWRGPAAEVRQYKYGNDDSMGLASCGQMWSGSRAPLARQGYTQ